MTSAYNIHVFFSDDTYFYIEISENIWKGNGSTFNGIIPTNGYHPLWALTLSVFGEWLSGEVSTLLFVRGLSYLIYGCGVFIVYRYVRNSDENLFISVALFPISLLLAYTGSTGSEAFLSFFSISLVLLLFLNQKEEGGWIQHAIFGASLGIMMLSRLDNVFLAGFICIFSLRRVGIKAVAKYILFASMLVIPYLIYNIFQFGHLTPISGFLKSSFPVVGPNVGGMSPIHTLLVVGILVLLPVFLWCAEDTKFRDSILALSAASIVQYGYFFAFGKAASWYWYAVLASLTAGLLTGWITSAAVRRFRQSADNVWLRKGVALLLGGLIYTAVASKALEPKHPMRIAAEKFDQVAPPNSVVYVDDWPGQMSFYTDCRVIAADGLTNDFSYLDRIKKPRRFFNDVGVDFITISSTGMTNTVKISNKSESVHNISIGMFKNYKKIYKYNTGNIRLYRKFNLPGEETLEVWSRN
ncbi:glycosyltransferase family 39 protein [Salinibacter ruber]|uniref:glycosyltransferase family 39 protein n=1 Tax=Salinibacter ruber TaxID=146919 RepID=UPI00216925B8|nr:glycosyltransferase family 39 protein [Salinibacter ruber]